LLNLVPALANEGPDWLSDPNELPKGVVTNDNVMVKKDSSAMSLIVQADRALKSDNIDRAIELIKRSLELNNDDLDAHMSYAQALERKLATQKVEDPKVFNQCIKEWLAVLRNKYGEEKNETINGIGIPGFNGRFFADEERQVPARNHLVKLAGAAPKPWETDTRYLAKVCRHGEASVSGKMVHDSKGDTKEPFSGEKFMEDSPATTTAKKPRVAPKAIGADPFPDSVAPASDSSRKTSAKPGADTD